MKTSRNIRYRRGTGWIPYRKRIYLYWFKFLQEVEMAPNNEFEVDWSKYSGWGGANAVRGQKFDDWWDERWFDLFGSNERVGNVNKKFEITTTQAKANALRTRLLIFQNRNTPPDWTPRDYASPDGFREQTTTKRSGGRTLAIALKCIQLEKAKGRSLAGMDLETGWERGLIEQEVQSEVGRQLRDAKKIAANVCEGRFP
jgi:hypothetical protein